MRSRDIIIGRGSNKVVFNFTNNSKGTRNGFAHETELRVNSCLYFYNKVNYYNRTWECYEFQTSMRGALALYQSHVEERIKQDILYKEGKKRMTPAIKALYEKECKKNKALKAIETCRAVLNLSYNW